MLQTIPGGIPTPVSLQRQQELLITLAPEDMLYIIHYPGNPQGEGLFRRCMNGYPLHKVVGEWGCVVVAAMVIDYCMYECMQPRVHVLLTQCNHQIIIILSRCIFSYYASSECNTTYTYLTLPTGPFLTHKATTYGGLQVPLSSRWYRGSQWLLHCIVDVYRQLAHLCLMAVFWSATSYTMYSLDHSKKVQRCSS